MKAHNLYYIDLTSSIFGLYVFICFAIITDWLAIPHAYCAEVEVIAYDEDSAAYAHFLRLERDAKSTAALGGFTDSMKLCIEMQLLLPVIPQQIKTLSPDLYLFPIKNICAIESELHVIPPRIVRNWIRYLDAFYKRYSIGEDSDMLYFRGQLNLREGDSQNALLDFQTSYRKLDCSSRSRSSPRDHYRLARIAACIGQILTAQGDLTEARKWFRESALNLRDATTINLNSFDERLTPLDSIGIIEIVRSALAFANMSPSQADSQILIDYGQAAFCLNDCLDFPNFTIQLVTILGDISSELTARGNAKSIGVANNALHLAMRLEAQTPKHRELQLRAIHVLAHCYSQCGDPDRSDEVCMTLTRVLNETGPGIDPGHVNRFRGLLLNIQGANASERRDIRLAKIRFLQALDVRRQLVSKHRDMQTEIDLAYSLMNYANICVVANEHDVGLQSCLEAIAILSSTNSSSSFFGYHSLLVNAHITLSTCYEMTDNLKMAFSASEEAIKLIEGLLARGEGKRVRSDIAATAYAQRADILILMQEWQLAETATRSAVSVLDDSRFGISWNDDSECRMNCLIRLAMIQRETQRCKESLGSTRQAMDIFVRMSSRSHVLTLNSFQAIWSQHINTQLQDGDIDGALKSIERGIDFCKSKERCHTTGMTEAECLKYTDSLLAFQTSVMNAWSKSQLSADWLYNVPWHQGGIVLREFSQRHRDLISMNESSINELLNERRVLSKQARRKIADQESVDRCIQRLDEVDRQVFKMIPSSEATARRVGTSPGELVNLPRKQEVFLDFWRFSRSRTPPVGTFYGAFVLRRGRPIEFVELGEEAVIDKAVDLFRQRVVGGERHEVEGENLRKLVWDPLEPFFPPETDVVYLTPDDDLHHVPWAALPGKESGSVLLERYAIATIPLGQFLCDWLRNPSPKPLRDSDCLVVGNVDYDASDVPRSPQRLQLHAAVRGEGLRYEPLPATRQEAERCAASAKPANRVIYLQGNEATVARVLQELPRVRCAHFATHGFFSEPKYRSILRTPEANLEGMRRIGSHLDRHPMLLSGLVFAGANRYAEQASEDDSDDDGILTADVISFLRLDRLDLAVLSACETGLGKVAGGEGVFGLQRAFHIAGARNVIASSWKVDDRATAALMEVFHRELFEKGRSPLQALRTAQLTLRQRAGLSQGSTRGRIDFTKTVRGATSAPDLSGPKLHPVYWAAFQLSGSGN